MSVRMESEDPYMQVAIWAKRPTQWQFKSLV